MNFRTVCSSKSFLRNEFTSLIWLFAKQIECLSCHFLVVVFVNFPSFNFDKNSVRQRFDVHEVKFEGTIFIQGKQNEDSFPLFLYFVVTISYTPPNTFAPNKTLIIFWGIFETFKSEKWYSSSFSPLILLILFTMLLIKIFVCK